MAIIYLVGPRASGKTTVGTLLAYHLDYDFYDLDQCLQNDCLTSIAQLVAEKGWNAFRLLESGVLRKTASQCVRPAVISTGGGIVLDAANRKFMAETGKIIWLKAPEAELARRLAKNPETAQRPSLTGNAVQDEVRQILKEREPLYAACAHHTVDGCESPKNICEKIAAILGLSCRTL